MELAHTYIPFPSVTPTPQSSLCVYMSPLKREKRNGQLNVGEHCQEKKEGKKMVHTLHHGVNHYDLVLPLTYKKTPYIRASMSKNRERNIKAFY